MRLKGGFNTSPRTLDGILPALDGSSSPQTVFNVKRKFDNWSAAGNLDHANVRALVAKAFASGLFIFADADIKFDQPQAEVVFDRDKLRSQGVELSQAGQDLSTLIGGNYVNRFSIQGRSYKVIPQVKRSERLTADQTSLSIYTAEETFRLAAEHPGAVDLRFRPGAGPGHPPAPAPRRAWRCGPRCRRGRSRVGHRRGARAAARQAARGTGSRRR